MELRESTEVVTTTVQRAVGDAELSCPVSTEQLCCRCRCLLRGDKPQCTITTALAHALLQLPESPHTKQGLVGSQGVPCGITHHSGQQEREQWKAP